MSSGCPAGGDGGGAGDGGGGGGGGGGATAAGTEAVTPGSEVLEAQMTARHGTRPALGGTCIIVARTEDEREPIVWICAAIRKA